MSSEMLGAYRLERQIGSGGMAEVWLALDTSKNRRVVIKRVLPHLDPAQYGPLLVEESRILLMLDHPNIVRFIEQGDAAGVPFIVMEFIEGSDLLTLLRAGQKRGQRVPLPVALRIAHEMSRGLAAVHGAMDPSGKSIELVHRDVNPHNVMVATSGAVKLLDFGIVKNPDAQRHTTPGAIKGKFAYMAPEQAADQKLDGRTDLFAVGLVLYEMLAGRRAYEQETEAAIYQAALNGRIDPIVTHASQLPAQVQQVIARALDPQPDRRFQTAESLAAELEGCGPLASTEEVARWRAQWLGEKATNLPVARAVPAAAGAASAPLELAAVERRPVEAPVHDFTGPANQPRVEVGEKPAPETSQHTPEPEVRQPTPIFPLLMAAASIMVVVIVGAQLVKQYADPKVVVAPVVDAGPAMVVDEPADTPQVADSKLPAQVKPPPEKEPEPVEEPHFFIDSVPSGANVWVNHQKVGVTPWGGNAPTDGGYLLELKLPGFRSWQKQIEAGDSFTATVSLER